jgi:hypothetical protein
MLLIFVGAIGGARKTISDLVTKTFLLIFALLIPVSVSLAAEPPCYFWLGDGYVNRFEALIDFNNDQGNDLADFNTNRPIGACSGTTNSTTKSLGPLQFTVQNGAQTGIVELTFYDSLYMDSHPIGGGQCSNREVRDRWTFSATGPLYGSSGVYCVAKVDLLQSISLAFVPQQANELRPTNTGGNSSTVLVARVVEGVAPKSWCYGSVNR